jgi:hypothetical protein
MTAASTSDNKVITVKQAQSPLVAGAAVTPIIPRTIEEVARIAKAVIVAGLAPDSYKGGSDEMVASKIMIGIMKGAEVGFAPLTALSTIAIIQGRPVIWGDGAVALVQRYGVVEKIEQTYEGLESGVGDGKEPIIKDFPDDFAAVCRIWRKDQPVPFEGRFSVRDAKRAGLWGNVKKSTWLEYPKRMLANRARAFAMRDGFADCLSGLQIREEIEDLPPEPQQVDVSFLNDAPTPVLGPTLANISVGQPLQIPAPVSEPGQARVALNAKAESVAGGGSESFDGWLAKLTPDDLAMLSQNLTHYRKLAADADASQP